MHRAKMRSSRHRGLKCTCNRGDASAVVPEIACRVALALEDPDYALALSDLDLPGHRLHPLKGDLYGCRRTSHFGNWQSVSRFEHSDATTLRRRRGYPPYCAPTWCPAPPWRRQSRRRLRCNQARIRLAAPGHAGPERTTFVASAPRRRTLSTISAPWVQVGWILLVIDIDQGSAICYGIDCYCNHPVQAATTINQPELVAERQGFEPWVPARALLISSQAHSSTLAPLQIFHSPHALQLSPLPTELVSCQFATGTHRSAPSSCRLLRSLTQRNRVAWIARMELNSVDAIDSDQFQLSWATRTRTGAGTSSLSASAAD